jgi:hypothetical protein
LTNKAGEKHVSDDLPGDIRQRIVEDFGAESADEIYQYLLEKIPDGLPNGTRPRQLRCILYLAKGDRKRLDEYIEMCLMDTRDVMVAAEYEAREYSDLVRLRDFAKPFGQEQVSKRKKGAS